MSKGGGRNVTTQTEQMRPNPAVFQRGEEALYGALRAVNSDFNDARERMYDAARGGGAINQSYNQLFDAANAAGNLGLLNQTASGAFLGANPYLDPMFDTMATRVGEQFRDYTTPGISSTASGAGRLGSGAYAQLRNDADQTLARELGDLANQVYYQNYATERQNQLAAQQGLAGYGQGILGDQSAYQLNAFNAAGNPYLDYAQAVFPYMGQDTTVTQATPRPRQSTLGTLGQIGMGIASIPLTGGTSLAAAAAPTVGGALFSGLFGGATA